MKHVLSLVLLILAASTVAFGQCSASDRQKLEAFDRAWGDAGQRGDQAFLQTVYADDYMNLSPTGAVTKTRAIENAVNAAARNRANPNPDKISHDYYIIICSPNSATITHRNVITASNYAADVTDVSSRTGALSTKVQVLSSVKDDKTVLEAADLSDLNVRKEGDTAVVTGINHVRGRDDKGQAFDRWYRFTDVFVKRDGRWQVLATQGTPIH